MRSEKALWIQFGEEDRMQPAPGFCLPSTTGQDICLADTYEQKNLVVYFAHGLDCRDCWNVLQGFAGHAGEYRAQESRVLVVFPEPISELAAEPGLRELDLALLSDEHGEARRSFAGLVDESLIAPEDGFIYLLDVYCAPYIAVVAPELDAGSQQNEGSLHADILSWLQFIGMQCPE